MFPEITPEQVDTLLIPFLTGFALGIHNGMLDMEPDWNRQFPDLRFVSVEEMLRGAWERVQEAGNEVSRV